MVSVSRSRVKGGVPTVVYRGRDALAKLDGVCAEGIGAETMSIMTKRSGVQRSD
jgi:hypothetical protein